MTFTRCAAVAVVLALTGAVGSINRASAAWDNVFQVCCHDCNKPRASYFAPPCPQPCPQPEVRVSYVQRTYYQPVTEYVRKSYYEPVTKKVTSYYYEPVTEYKYSTYYDPCTGCPQRVCTPCTSYRLRSQCNSVTSYVERCAMVPVTTLKPVCVQQPVVSYYYPPPKPCPDPCPPTGASFYPFPPPAGVRPPSVNEFREGTGVPGAGSDNLPPMKLPTQPGMMESNPRPGNAKLRPEKTVSRSSVVSVRGEVVLNDQITPRSGAKLVFMNAEKPEQKLYTSANAYGEFDLRLPAGTWFMYVGGEKGDATYHKKVSVGDRDTEDFKVVSR